MVLSTGCTILGGRSTPYKRYNWTRDPINPTGDTFWDIRYISPKKNQASGYSSPQGQEIGSDTLGRAYCADYERMGEECHILSVKTAYILGASAGQIKT